MFWIRDGRGRVDFYKAPSLPSVESRTLGKAKFAECQITALDKVIFAECLHSANLSLLSVYLLPSVFFLVCRVPNFAECLLPLLPSAIILPSVFVTTLGK